MCLFCKIIEGEIPSTKIYEDDNVLAILDVNPITPNHTLVMPKKHFKNAIDIDEELFKEVMGVAQKLANKHLSESDSKGYNIIINNNSEANQAIDHLHVHIVYRKDKDDINYFSAK